MCKLTDLDLVWINSIAVDDAEVKSTVTSAKFSNNSAINEKSTKIWLKKAIQCVDLTSLVGNETPELIKNLCHKALYPFDGLKDGDVLLNTDGDLKVQCAAICIYPLRLDDAFSALQKLDVQKSMNVAAVAAGFPTGQFPLHTRLGEIYYVVASGAQEIDVVIDRSLVLRGLWEQLYRELCQMRTAACKAKLKVILSVTECGSWTNVYKAAVVAMSAGADFIKTSTGKEAAAMTIHDGFVMVRAIKDFYGRTGIKVGLKPAGGIRTAEQAISWMMLVQEVLGEEWLTPNLFRIGTSSSSSMIDNIYQALKKC